MKNWVLVAIAMIGVSGAAATACSGSTTDSSGDSAGPAGSAGASGAGAAGASGAGAAGASGVGGAAGAGGGAAGASGAGAAGAAGAAGSSGASGAGGAGAAGAGGNGGGAAGAGPDTSAAGYFADPSSPACYQCLIAMTGKAKDLTGPTDIDCAKVNAACGPKAESCSASLTCMGTAVDTGMYTKSLDCAVNDCVGDIAGQPKANEFLTCAADKCGAPCGFTIGFTTKVCKLPRRHHHGGRPRPSSERRPALA